MKIIEIEPLSNGGHRNQSSDSMIVIPEGWAKIPEDMEFPNSFPFVDIEVEEQTVIKMNARKVPEPEPQPDPEPTAFEKFDAQLTYTAMMTNTLIESE